MSYRYSQLFTAMLLLLGYSNCLKPSAERPPYLGAYDPQLPVNGSLTWLNTIVPAEGQPVLLDTAITIAVTVSADDRSGNLYDQLILEDSAAGICIRLNSAYLYTRYPAGRKVYLRIQDLYLGNDHGLPCLGGTPAPDNAGVLQVSAISPQQIAQHLVPANFPDRPAPVDVRLADIDSLQPQLLNRLIRIHEIQLVNPGYDRTYATSSSALNIRLQNCDGHEIILRSSNYAAFSNAITPAGKGSITAIYSVYNNTPQLLIRDIGDVDMTGPRCDGSTGTVITSISIRQLRALYQDSDTVLSGHSISGIVITDAASKNHGANGSLVLADSSAGIIVYFGSAVADIPILGDSMLLDLEGSTLTRYNGALEIKNIRTSAVTTLAASRTLAPIPLTIAALLADFSHYESRLVRIDNAKVKNKGNYSGSRTLTDGTGEIVLFTSSSASFATQPLPSISKTFQGIPTWYDTLKELKIRNPDIDVY